jgi:serine/threonine protein kinase
MNIVLYIRNTQTGKYIFKLADFGIARIVPLPEECATPIGDSNFIAPEVRSGHFYKEQADLYSLGRTMVLLYHVPGMPSSWTTLWRNLCSRNSKERMTALHVRTAAIHQLEIIYRYHKIVSSRSGHALIGSGEFRSLGR